MRKQKQIKKLVLSKHVIGNLNTISGGRPPGSRNCPSDVPADDQGGFTSFCSVIACNSKIGC
jgi:hypothetical protein